MSCRLLVASALALTAALAAAPAHADTVTGTFRFRDTNNLDMPIVGAKVEIWRWRPMFETWGAWNWNMDRVATTNAGGQINEVLPFLTPGVTYGVRVFATNSAAQVFIQDNVFTPFWREPGLPGPEIQRTVHTAFDAPLSFTHTFTDDWARRHFNVADAIRIARGYADANRDPRETDTIGRVDVMMQGCCNTYFDPGAHLIRLGPEFHLDDLTIVHEYAHYLADQIGSIFALASIHNGCDSGVVSGPGIAWQEAWGSYFAQTVALATGDLFGPGLGTSSINLLENPTLFCTAGVPAASAEGNVAGVLWDLHDFLNESGDRACARDGTIFQIFDHELDLGWVNPTIHQFASAWLARGLDARPLLSAMAINGIAPPSVPTATAYSPAAGADIAVWRPSGGTWFIRNVATINWGVAGDLPVPADYDGDGLTDLTVFRPSALATWHIRKSQGNVQEIIQWGTSGDIPLAADRDGDGEAEVIVYRPSNSTFFIHGDTCTEGGFVPSIHGQPAAGRFDGDAFADMAVYAPSTGQFRVTLATGAVQVATFPTGGTMMSRDYDGDGRMDRGVYTPDGTFHYDRSSTGARVSTWWGMAGELPAPADHDPTVAGVELATWSPSSGQWFIRRNSNGSMMPIVQWGTFGDVPVPSL